MSAEVTFEDQEIKEFLLNLETRLADIENGKAKYLGLLSAIVYRDIMHHFEKEEGSEGPWAPWSFLYAKEMVKKNKGGNKILQDSGRLRQTFLPTNVRSASRGISWFNNATTESGFQYAYAHNEGGPRLPKRDFMWASDKAQDDIAYQTLQFMMDEGI